MRFLLLTMALPGLIAAACGAADDPAESRGRAIPESLEEGSGRVPDGLPLDRTAVVETMGSVDRLDGSLPPRDAEPDGSGPPPLPECPAFLGGMMVGQVAAPDLSEASGMVVSLQQEDVAWLHNDSGDMARLFALATDGTYLGSWTLQVGVPFDCEALALGPAPDGEGDHLFLADIGDNGKVREALWVYRTPEPLVDGEGPPGEVTVTDVTTLTLRYPGGQAHDCEAFAVDPVTGDFYLFTKTGDVLSEVFRAPAPAAGTEVVLEDAGSLEQGLVTAADISASGDRILVRGYFDAALYRRLPGQEVVDALLGPPCPVPIIAEPQGETVAFAPDGAGYFSVSEGTSQPIYFYEEIL